MLIDWIVGSNSDYVKATVNAYRDALVSSDVPAVLKLYTEDGVTMAQNFPTQVGQDAIQSWYTKCFELITLNVKFDIKEVVVVSDEYAFARTASVGTQKQNSTGATSNEANQELFVMQKVDSQWKIARYCFNSTNPPR